MGKRDTRQKIVEAAVAVFARAGFSQATFQQIADLCGLTQPAAFYYFRTKEELIPAALDWIVVENHAYVSRAASPKDDARTRLLKHFDGNLRWAVGKPEQAQLLLLMFYYAGFDSRYAARYGKMLDGGRARIAEILHAGKREGVFGFKEPVEQITEHLHDSLAGAFVSVLRTRSEKGTKAAEAELKRRHARSKTLFKTLLAARPT